MWGCRKPSICDNRSNWTANTQKSNLACAGLAARKQNTFVQAQVIYAGLRINFLMSLYIKSRALHP